MKITAATTAFSMMVGGDGIISLQGSLILATVEPLLKQSSAIFQQQMGDLTIDLAGVSHVDSAGLALLIHWLRELRAAGRYLSYIQTPSHLLHLAQTNGVENILPFAAVAAENLTQ